MDSTAKPPDKQSDLATLAGEANEHHRLANVTLIPAPRPIKGKQLEEIKRVVIELYGMTDKPSLQISLLNVKKGIRALRDLLGLEGVA